MKVGVDLTFIPRFKDKVALARKILSPLELKEYENSFNKEEYLAVVDEWLSPEKQDKPIVFEVFTLDRDESNALKLMNTIERSMKGCGKKIVRKVLGQKGVKYLKKLLGR